MGVNAMTTQRALKLKGLDTAPDYFIDALYDIQFLGANTLFIPVRNAPLGAAGPFRTVPFVCRIPTGALLQIHRKVEEFVREHQLLRRWDHESTRSPV